MIKFEKNNENNSLKVELTSHAFDLFKEKLPFLCVFESYVTNEEIWSHTLNAGTWVVWNGGIVPFNLKVLDNQNNLIYQRLYSEEDMEELDQMFNFYTHMNKNTKGIVIGSHDGTFGHWVKPVRENKTKCLLVEGSKYQFMKLFQNYNKLDNCVFINEIVTDDGKDVVWFTGGEGFTDSVEKSTLEIFLNDESIKSELRKSISINDLIEKFEYQKFDWLHTDVEGYDDKIIMSLKYFPKIIIFENAHVKRMNNYEKLENFLMSKNYKLIDFGFDTLAIKQN